MAQYTAGVDVGGHSVKIVVGRLKLRSVEIVERHEVPISRDEQGTPLEDGLERAMGELVARLETRPDVVFSALPADAVHLRTVSVPRAAARKSDAVVLRQIEDDLPIDMAAAVFDHVAVDASAGPTMTALAAVAPHEAVAEHVALLQRAGLDPAEVGVGAAAYSDLARVMPRLADPEPEMVVDIGSDRTDVLVIEAGATVAMRTISVGGADFTRTLAAHHGVGFEQAERFKVECHWSQLSGVLGPILERLAQQLRQTMIKHASTTGRRVVKVFTCGGTSLLAGLNEALAGMLAVEVASLESENPAAAGDEEGDGPFLRAAALAHRALPAPSELRFDMRKGPFTYRGQARATRRRWVRAVIAVVVIVLGWSFYSLARISSLEARRAAQRERLAELSGTYLGEEVTDFDRAQKLMKSAKPVKSPMPKADAFDFVREMSVMIPEEIVHDIEELEIKPGKVEIRGIVDTIAARDEIITRLEDYDECVVAISKGKTTQSPKDNRQKYTLDVETECP
jgi:Tfp pilus assembly PilM family ATPase